MEWLKRICDGAGSLSEMSDTVSNARSLRDALPIYLGALALAAGAEPVLRRRRPGPARHRQLRRRVPDPDRQLPDRPLGGGPRRLWPGPRLGLLAGDDPPCLLRPGTVRAAAAGPQGPRAVHGARPGTAADPARRLPATRARHLCRQHAGRAAVVQRCPHSTCFGPVIKRYGTDDSTLH